MLRVSLTSPRSNKFGLRLQSLCSICEPTPEDYEAFIKGWNPPQPNAVRDEIGLVTSAHSDPNESSAIAFIQALAFVKLLRQAQSRLKTKRRIFVLIRQEYCTNVFQWGIAFLSIMS